jgi:triacylglycerol lipase
MAKIVLAHGILGVGSVPIFGGGIYFNRVAPLYTSRGHEVLEPTVDPLGSLDARSSELANTINSKWPGDDDIYIVAHSMGGLDARRVVARDDSIGRRVRKVLTVATPHLGSPVADALLDGKHPLRPHIPHWLIAALGSSAAALQDLRTREVLQDADRGGVQYIRIACDASAAGTASPLFTLTQAIGRLSSIQNDGVVTIASAVPPGATPAAIWPVDHGGAIGWPSGLAGLSFIAASLTPPPDHIARYLSLLALLSI